MSERIRVRILRLLVAAVIAAASALGLVSLVYLFGGQSALETTHHLLARRPVVDGAARSWPVLSALLEHAPHLFLFLVSYPAAWWKSDRAAGRLNERFFAEFDAHLFEHVAKPQAAVDTGWGIDPSRNAPLPWIKPFHGPREKAWTALENLTATGTSVGRTALPAARPHISVPFAWLVIAGRPGSGKTRLVHEFARHAGCTEMLETSPKAWRTRQLRFTDWLHRACWFLRRTRHRVWDIGKIRMFLDQVSLQGWQPRRPTLLMLDEPKPGACSRVLHALAHGSRRWRHPVRLVILDQSLANDLPIRFAQGRWTTEPGAPPLLGDPVVLDETARFTKGEVEMLFARTGLQDRVSLRYDGEDLARFMSATEGNPLLVELGLDWLRRAQPLGEISKSRLLEDRVRRILQAFANVGIDESRVENLRALACATLVGPHAARAPIVAEFGELPVGEQVRRLIPADGSSDLLVELPAVRPETIGDALVQTIVRLSDPGRTAERIVRTGARANAGRWLRALRRLAGDPQSALGTALCQPADLSIFSGGDTWADALRTYLEVGLSRRLSLEQTMTVVGDLLTSATDTSLAWRAFEQTVEFDWGLRVQALQEGLVFETAPTFARSHHITGLGLQILDAGHHEPTNLAERVNRLAFLLDHALRRGHSYAEWDEDWRLLSDAVRATFTDASIPVDRAAFDACERLDRLLRNRYSHLTVAKSIFETIVRLVPAEPSVQKTAARCRRICATHGDESRAAIEHIEQLCSQPDLVADEALQLERLRAWRMLLGSPRESLVPPGASPLAMINEILTSGSHLNNPEMTLEYAEAMCSLACHYVDVDRTICLQAVEQVEHATTTQPLADHADAQYERIVAWRCQVEALAAEDLSAALAATETVESIGGRRLFAADRGIQFARVQSWRMMAEAHAGRDVQAALGFAERVERVAGIDAFAADRNIQYERVRNWRTLAEGSWLDRPDSCLHAVDKVELIASQPEYLLDRAMQWERARTWSARGKVMMRRHYERMTESTADEIERTAHKIIAICAPERFAGDGDMQYLLVRALFGLIFTNLRKKQVQAAVDTVARIDRVASTKELANHRDVQYERIYCWAYLANGCKLSSVDHCLEACSRAEAVAADEAFANDVDVQRAHMMALSAASMAVSGHDEKQCVEFAERAEAIGARRDLQQDIEIQRLRLETWNWVSLTKSTYDLQSCQQIAERIETIAIQTGFVDNEQIQLQRASTWHHLASAQMAAGLECRAAVMRVESITTREPFLTNSAFQRQRAAAWNCLAVYHYPHGDPSWNGQELLAAVSHVESITCAERFLKEGDIQYERVNAWSHAARSTSDIPTCNASVQNIEKVMNTATVGEYARLFVYPRLAAWHRLAALLQHNKDDCEQAVHFVEEIASDAAVMDAKTQALRACSWVHLVNACRDVDLEKCRMAVEKIDEIAAAEQFASDRGLQYMRITAWRAAVDILQLLLPECRTALKRVEQIATLPAFIDDQAFQLERLNAWRRFERNPHLGQSERDEASRRIAQLSTEQLLQTEAEHKAGEACDAAANNSCRSVRPSCSTRA